jgi:hypothetical protein
MKGHTSKSQTWGKSSERSTAKNKPRYPRYLREIKRRKDQPLLEDQHE